LTKSQGCRTAGPRAISTRGRGRGKIVANFFDDSDNHSQSPEAGTRFRRQVWRTHVPQDLSPWRRSACRSKFFKILRGARQGSQAPPSCDFSASTPRQIRPRIRRRQAADDRARRSID
jgi:hypothetical protein